MLTGLCALRVDNSGNITKLWARNMDSDDLDDAMNGEGDFVGFGSDTNDTLYYFGSNEDSDGALKTGSVSVNLDGDTVYAYGTLGSLVSGKASSNYYLLNTSGTIVKNKTAAKDGNDWYFYVDNKVIKMYTNNNTLTGGVEDLKKDWNVESKLISDGIAGDVLDTDMVDDGI